MLARLSNDIGTFTISRNVHCCDSEVDVGPQVWKRVLSQVAGITTSLCHIYDSACSADVAAQNIARYIWLHFSYVEGWWGTPCEMLVVGLKLGDLEVRAFP